MAGRTHIINLAFRLQGGIQQQMETLRGATQRVSGGMEAMRSRITGIQTTFVRMNEQIKHTVQGFRMLGLIGMGTIAALFMNTPTVAAGFAVIRSALMYLFVLLSKDVLPAALGVAGAIRDLANWFKEFPIILKFTQGLIGLLALLSAIAVTSAAAGAGINQLLLVMKGIADVTAKVTAKVAGLADVTALKTAIDGLKDKIVNVRVDTTGIQTQTENIGGKLAKVGLVGAAIGLAFGVISAGLVLIRITLELIEPIIKNIGKWISTDIVPNIRKFADWLDDIDFKLGPINDFASWLANHIRDAASYLGRFAGYLAEISLDIPSLEGVFERISGFIGEFLKFGWKGETPSKSWLSGLRLWDAGGFVTRTGPAILHAGEQVVPSGGGPGSIAVNISFAGASFTGTPQSARMLARQIADEVSIELNRRYINTR